MKKTILAVILAITTLGANAQNPVIHTCSVAASEWTAPSGNGNHLYTLTTTKEIPYTVP